jgi:hypothetical protein
MAKRAKGMLQATFLLCLCIAVRLPMTLYYGLQTAHNYVAGSGRAGSHRTGNGCNNQEIAKHCLQLLRNPGCKHAAAMHSLGRDDARYDSLAGLCNTSYATELEASLAEGFHERLESALDGKCTVREAFVSFIAGDRYSQLVTVPLQAVMQLASKPVVLFVAGGLATPPHIIWPATQYPRLVVYTMERGLLHPWFDKLRAVLLSPVNHGAVIEADTIPTWHSERLFTALAHHGRQYPLLVAHPDVRLPTCANFANPSRTCGNPFPYPAHKRTMDYSHAHIMWTARNKGFLADVLATCASQGTQWGHSVPSVEPLDCSSDESALNQALWNVRANTQLMLMDPFHGYVDAWATRNWTGMQGDNYHRRFVAFMYVHGAKDVALQTDLFARIKAIGHDAPWWYGPQPGMPESTGPYMWGNDANVLATALQSTNMVV